MLRKTGEGDHHKRLRNIKQISNIIPFSRAAQRKRSRMGEGARRADEGFFLAARQVFTDSSESRKLKNLNAAST
jgi:hypothetical protein